jgi:hypothetical protein
MQNQTKDAETKLVSLFGARNAAAKDKDDGKNDGKEEGFFDAMKKNHDNEERLRKERLKANQSVLKSYRIKN